MPSAYVHRMGIADVVGEEIYRRARCNPRRPPDGGAVDVAIGLLGRGAVVLQPRARAEATIATVDGRRKIVIRSEASPERINFLAGKQLARLWLAGDAWFGGLAPLEQLAATRAIGAWLAAPTPAFSAEVGAVGENIGALADAFAVTWTCATMRLSETGGSDSVITTPTSVYRRGRLLHGFDDAAVRDLAARRAPRSVRRVVIRDEPGRVALLARAG